VKTWTATHARRLPVSGAVLSAGRSGLAFRRGLKECGMKEWRDTGRWHG